MMSGSRERKVIYSWNTLICLHGIDLPVVIIGMEQACKRVKFFIHPRPCSESEMLQDDLVQPNIDFINYQMLFSCLNVGCTPQPKSTSPHHLVETFLERRLRLQAETS
jgi:hypothetical protein